MRNKCEPIFSKIPRRVGSCGQNEPWTSDKHASFAVLAWWGSRKIVLCRHFSTFSIQSLYMDHGDLCFLLCDFQRSVSSTWSVYTVDFDRYWGLPWRRTNFFSFTRLYVRAAQFLLFLSSQVGFAEFNNTADNRANIGGTIIGAPIVGQ